jgi:hypothetical protein
MKKYLLISIVLFLISCKNETNNLELETSEVSQKSELLGLYPFDGSGTTKIDSLLNKYTPFTLTTDIAKLTESEKQMIPKLIEVAKIMDELFWYEALGDKEAFLNSINDDKLKAFSIINYGPYDRLGGNATFIEGTAAKPLGANFYPTDMTKEEFEAAEIADKSSLYTFIRRDENGKLKSIPYHQMFPTQIAKASELLTECAAMAEDQGFKNYLTLRAAALLNDEYQASDMAWLDMKSNHIDIVVGPIENYEDQLYAYKAAHEAYVLVKDMEWSEKLAKYAQFLPELQTGLPVEAKYKAEKPGSDTDLNAYDVIYYAGDCNAGSKTIAINLPNDEEVQLKKGTRRLQLKNAMRAKFDKILVPIADELIDEGQRNHITFDAFFANTMFHEVAHGLGIKNTINGKGTVREALKEYSSALEEGKADMLGLYMVNQLHKKGEIEGDIKDYIVTFMTSIFRSVRFGASSAHGKANMIRFNYFAEKEAFSKDEASGRYKINFDNFQIAMDDLSELILVLQGDGDYDKVAQLVADKAVIKPSLQQDLDKLASKGIPVDVIFEQGTAILGL